MDTTVSASSKVSKGTRSIFIFLNCFILNCLLMKFQRAIHHKGMASLPWRELAGHRLIWHSLKMIIITNDDVEYVGHHPQDLYHYQHHWEWDVDSLNISPEVVKITIILICNDRKIHNDESKMTMICILIMISKIIMIINITASEPRINWTFLWKWFHLAWTMWPQIWQTFD